MSKLVIHPSQLSGTVNIPPSKSQTMRAILFACFSDGKSTIHHVLESPDTECMIKACQMFGAVIQRRGDSLVVTAAPRPWSFDGEEIDCGNSGLILRFVSVLAAFVAEPVRFVGDSSLCRRPMKDLLLALADLGVEIDLENGYYAPFTIQGRVQKSSVRVRGSDSQPVSALLIGSALSGHSLTIDVRMPGEKPWVDVTLEWLDRLQVVYTREGYSRYEVLGSTKRSGFSYTVPGDWSTLSFPLSASILTQSPLDLQGLCFSDSQGDKKILSFFEQMGVCFAIDEKNHSMKVVSSDSLEGIKIDVDDCIDAIVPLSVVACFAKGKTEIVNAESARHKECDRIAVLAKNIEKMGGYVEELSDGLLITPKQLQGTTLSSFSDHRIAMAFAVAALRAKGKTEIEDAFCIEKTYPCFVEDLQRVGANIRWQ